MRLIKSIGRVIPGVLALSTMVTGLAAAQSVPAPAINSQSNGSYVVSYNRCSVCFADGLEVFNPQTGHWDYAGTVQLSVSNPVPGTYRYRVVYVVFVGLGSYQSVYGPERSIAIGQNMRSQQAKRPSLAAQFASDYSISAGDVDGDGLRDFLIKRSSPIPEGGDGTIADVLLRQSSQGSFVSSLPNQQQRAIAAGWAPAPVALGKRDINIDGFLDLTIQGVDGVSGFSRASNQILLAPGSKGRDRPPSVREVDDKLARFSRDVDRHLVDPDYFINNVPTRYERISYYRFNCDWRGYGYASMIDASFSYHCYTVPQYLYVAYRDFAAFDQHALKVASTDYGMIHGTESMQSGMDTIASTIATVLGVAIGGRDINELLGQEAAVTEEADRLGMELFSALAGISEAVAQAANDAAELPVTERVEIKGRRVLGQGPFHTVLEFRDSTVSAHDSDQRAIFDGKLVSEVNWPRDHPSLTLRMGFVDGPSTPPTYWNSIVASDRRYDDNLPYDLFPSLGQGGYNSNSYVSGLIQPSHGIPTIALESFVGAERPVPSSAFN